jgi:hypothetical protein
LPLKFNKICTLKKENRRRRCNFSPVTTPLASTTARRSYSGQIKSKYRDTITPAEARRIHATILKIARKEIMLFSF